MLVWNKLGGRSCGVGGSEEKVRTNIHLGEARPYGLGFCMGVCHDEVTVALGVRDVRGGRWNMQICRYVVLARAEIGRAHV